MVSIVLDSEDLLRVRHEQQEHQADEHNRYQQHKTGISP